MREQAADLGTKAIAVVVLAAVAWILFKVVLGFVTFVAWTAVVIIAVIAGIWALAKLF
jgi:hypothetical protein